MSPDSDLKVNGVKQNTRRNPMVATTFRRLWQTHAALTLSGLIMAFLTLFFIVGIFTDPRVITGAPAWMKPAKFGISITLYNLTLTWLLGFIRGRRWLVNILGWMVVLIFTLEMFVVVTQVVRGTTSHFNLTTPFDAALFSAMGVAIAILWLVNLVIAGLLLFQKFDNAAFAWALRLGLIVTIVGMGLGSLMTNPTAQQMADWETGGAVDIVGAHTVGLADGGPGLPFVGWSTVSGDLRIPHFIGMHALQLIPFVGWLISRRKTWSTRTRIALVSITASFYLSLTLLLLLQALRAQPLLQPDALTLGLFAGMTAVAGIAAWIVTRGSGAKPNVPESAYV